MLFLGATVLVVPVFKAANQSPVLGYLFAGVVMGQLGLFRDMNEIERLSELGVLFLLFEMGLELSLDKLRALAKYAFGLGSLQMLVTTAAFLAASLPVGGGVMSLFLENVMGAPPVLARIGSVDEGLVVAVALSLSSSAFVLQLLKERGELDSKFGQATLGILLFQDIATVPFLVLLPLLEGRGSGGFDNVDGAALLSQLAPTIAKTGASILLLLLGGRTFLRGVFEVAASAKSSEVFIALCLLSVAGASLLTEKLGFSDTLGAFVSGVLLSETNFKAQVEADIQPFRGLLLGLFFVTTGASLDLALLIREWPTVLVLLAGLISAKATLITAIGPAVGLTRAESIRTGFVLSQGGEFAFVLLALAAQLNVLPPELNKLLIIVVVLSMSATPLLTEAGKRVAEMVAELDGEELSRSAEGFNQPSPVLICGFGDVGQAVANMLVVLGTPYVAFDLTVPRVQAGQNAGFNVLYGDATRLKVLQSSGISKPRAIAVGYMARGRAVAAVAALRAAFPTVPIMARAIDMTHAAEMQAAGATQVVSAESEAGVAVGTQMALTLGYNRRVVGRLAQALRNDMQASSARQWAEQHEAEPKSVYKFDGTQPSGPAGGSMSDSSDDEAAGGGLVASIGQAMLAASGGEAGGGTPSSDTLVTIRREGESFVLPDGSIECPIVWDADDEPYGVAAAVAASVRDDSGAPHK